MKILYCINQIHTHGGIEKILALKINSLIQDFKHEVYLCTTDQKKLQFIYEIESAVQHNDLRINYNYSKSYYHPKNLIKIVRNFLKLKKYIRKIKPDVVVSVSFTPDQYFIPFIFKKTAKIKELHSSGVIVSKSLDGQNGLKNSFKNFLIDIFNKYDALVVLNKDELSFFPNANSIEINNFTNIKSDLITVKEKTIIAVGRISDVKNFEELAYIWSKIHMKFPDWCIKIFGDGTDFAKEKLQSIIKSLHLEKSFLYRVYLKFTQYLSHY